MLRVTTDLPFDMLRFLVLLLTEGGYITQSL